MISLVPDYQSEKKVTIVLGMVLATFQHQKIVVLTSTVFDSISMTNANRTFILNDRIPLNWFNLSFETYKVKCKIEFLKNLKYLRYE